MPSNKVLKRQQHKESRKEQVLRDEDALFREWVAIIEARLHRWYPERYPEKIEAIKASDPSPHNVEPGKLWEKAPYEVCETKKSLPPNLQLPGPAKKTLVMNKSNSGVVFYKWNQKDPVDYFSDFIQWAFDYSRARKDRRQYLAEQKQLQRAEFLDEYFGNRVEDCFRKYGVKPWDRGFEKYGDGKVRRERWCAEQIDFIRCCWYGGFEVEEGKEVKEE